MRYTHLCALKLRGFGKSEQLRQGDFDAAIPAHQRRRDVSACRIPSLPFTGLRWTGTTKNCSCSGAPAPSASDLPRPSYARATHTVRPVQTMMLPALVRLARPSLRSEMQHPNVCSLVAARAWPPEYYLVFPYMVRPGSLLSTERPAPAARRLRRRRFLSPPKSQRWRPVQENGSLGDLIHNQQWRPSRQVPPARSPCGPVSAIPAPAPPNFTLKESAAPAPPTPHCTALHPRLLRSTLWRSQRGCGTSTAGASCTGT